MLRLSRLTAVLAATGLLLAPASAGLAQPPAPPASPPLWAPPVVTDLTAVSATLTWTSPTTDPEVSHYRIYRVTTRDGRPYDQLYNASYTTSLLLALLTPDTDYTFFVETGDQTSNGLRSEPVTFRTPPAPDDTEPPTPPGKPAATPHSANSLTLSWAAASDNVGVVVYDLYRTHWNGTVELVARKVAIGTDDLSWRFERLLPDFDYQFHVVAVDAAGNESEPSESLPVRTLADPGSSCEVSFTATALGTGLVEGMIALTNTGTFAEVWTLRFELPGGQQIQYGPLPGWVQDGTEVVAWYEGWADGLGPGERLMPFLATGSVSDPPPTGYVLNGQPCTAQ